MPEQVQIQLRITDETLKGHYANMVNVTRTSPEEFVLDFSMIVPPLGELVSRVVLSPGHLKKLTELLSDQVKKHEQESGSQIEKAEFPSGKIGFVPPSQQS